MKKIFTLFVAALFTLGVYADYTVYFVNTSGWTDVSCYAWTANDGSDKNANWPGVAMTATGDNVGGYAVYSYTSATEFTNVIFNNNNNGSQTANLTWTTGKYFYLDAWYNTLADVPTTKTVYFANVDDWANVYCYAWTANDGSDKNADWPGVAMTMVSNKIDGHDVYSYTTTATHANVIFSNGTDIQTANLTWQTGKYFCGQSWYAGNNLPNAVFHIYVMDGTPWGSNALYAWTSDGSIPSLCGSWPGCNVRQGGLRTDGTYRMTLCGVRGTTYNLIFNNTKGTQLSDVSYVFNADVAYSVKKSAEGGATLLKHVVSIDANAAYATLFSDYAVTIPANTTAYTAVYNATSSTLSLNAIAGNVIPAATPVIVSGDGGDFVYSSSEATVSAANDLRGSGVETTVTENAGVYSATIGTHTGAPYVLGYVDNETGFYKYTGATIPANKAVLLLNAGAASAPVRIVEASDVATSLDAANAADNVRKFVENGKLIIVKNGVRYNALGQIVK